MNCLAFLPLISMLVSVVFAGIIFRRFLARRGTHLLLWAVGMLFYGTSGFCEAYYGFFGWNPLVFRLWYIFGAILVAAWLGQGTVYLLARKPVAHVLMVILGLGSLFALARVFNAELDPTFAKRLF